jgi:nitrate/nitrite transporter NarK
VALIVGLLFGAQLVLAILPLGLGALAPFMRDRFDLTRGEVGLTATAVFVSVALFSIPMGRLADRIGVAGSISIAATIVALGMAWMAVAERYGVLLGALAVGGVGYAAVTPATNKGVLAVVRHTRRGRAMGVKQMGVTASGMVAAAVLPASIVRHGWTPTLLATAAGIATLGIGAAFAYRLVTGERLTRDDAAHDSPPGVARRLLALGAVVGMLVAAQYAVATYLILFLVDERMAQIAAAAAALALLHATGAVARLGWGYVSDRLGGGRLQTIALIGATSVVGLVTLAAIGDSLPWPALLVLVAFLGVSTQGGNAVYQTALVEEDETRAGRASGIGMTLGFAGAIVMPPAFGATVDATGSYAVPFLAVAVGVGAASIGALRLAGRSTGAGPMRPGALDGEAPSAPTG